MVCAPVWQNLACTISTMITWQSMLVSGRSYSPSCKFTTKNSHGCHNSVAWPVCKVFCGWLPSTSQYSGINETSIVGKCQQDFDGGPKHGMMIEEGRMIEPNQETRWCLPWIQQRQMWGQAENEGQVQRQGQETTNAQSKWQPHWLSPSKEWWSTQVEQFSHRQRRALVWKPQMPMFGEPQYPVACQMVQEVLGQTKRKKMERTTRR